MNFFSSSTLLTTGNGNEISTIQGHNMGQRLLRHQRMGIGIDDDGRLCRIVVVKVVIKKVQVCILAYGQIGFGKSYTMMGRQQVAGLIPCSLKQVFSNKSDTCCPELEVQSAVGGKKYDISHDSNGNTNVSDVTIVDVTGEFEVSNLLKSAAQSRSEERGKRERNDTEIYGHICDRMKKRLGDKVAIVCSESHCRCMK
ncbi:hypothetical protein L1887_15052 [Cichorium endivia]|nr:hypothetical protein L1887_15052 [Cichorium endivia]